MLNVVSTLNKTFEKTDLWLKELKELGHFDSKEQAYSSLRAVLQTLRDRLPINEAADVGAQLPLLIRGIYYEGWCPSHVPSKEKSAKEFLEKVSKRLQGNKTLSSEPEKATKAVFTLLKHKLSPGEIDDIEKTLPESIKNLF